MLLIIFIIVQKKAHSPGPYWLLLAAASLHIVYVAETLVLTRFSHPGPPKTVTYQAGYTYIKQLPSFAPRDLSALGGPAP